MSDIELDRFLDRADRQHEEDMVHFQDVTDVIVAQRDEAVRHLRALLGSTEWIKAGWCPPPDETGAYLVITDNRRIGGTVVTVKIITYVNGAGWMTNGWEGEVTHWMQKPALPGNSRLRWAAAAFVKGLR